MVQADGSPDAAGGVFGDKWSVHVFSFTVHGSLASLPLYYSGFSWVQVQSTKKKKNIFLFFPLAFFRSMSDTVPVGK
jgi:hypothetical protein